MDRLRTLPVSLLCLFLAIIIYALAGSPTPDNPGIIEVAIGGLLVLSIGAAGLSRSADFFYATNGFIKAVQVMFIAGLIFPTLTGVYYGNNHMLMLRDLLAFTFLGLPLFLSERVARNDTASVILTILLLMTGVLFSLRTLLPAFNIWIPQGELLYLSNSPLTLYAAVYLAGMIWTMMLAPRKADVIRIVVMAAGLALLIGAMLLDVQRATVGAIIITLLVLVGFDLIKTPRKAIMPFLILCVLIAALYPVMSEMLQAMAQKTARVGMNMRVQEAQAVFDALMASPPALFAGLGWGASFSSPAVGYLDVNFTHSLLTTMALKGGIIMMILTMVVAVAGLYQVAVIFRADRARGLALFWPLIIPVLLYASHKSLDFGLVLLLIGVWSIRGQMLHRGEASCKT